MCWMAVGFLLIIAAFVLGRSYKEILVLEDLGEVVLEGEITDKQYKESSYEAYWQITLKNVQVLRNGKTNLSGEKEDADIIRLEGKYLCRISSKEEAEFKLGGVFVGTGSYKRIRLHA